MSAPPAGVGFVGLGQIGAPMARHMTGWPAGLVVHDVRAEATAEFAAAGATVAGALGEVAGNAGVISVMVRDDAQAGSVVSELLDTAAAGTIIAVHSTIRARTAERLAAAADERGVHVVDAPVSGGVIGANDGTLAVMVGGTDDAVQACRAPFGCFATLVCHVGPVGAGTRAKLARNLIHYVSFVAAAEAQALASASGVDLRELARVVRHSDAITGGPGAIMVRDAIGDLADDDPLRPIFTHTRDLGEKDLALALELAGELGVDLPLAGLASTRLARALGVAH